MKRKLQSPAKLNCTTMFERSLMSAMKVHNAKWLDDNINRDRTLVVLPNDFLTIYETNCGHRVILICSHFIAHAWDVCLLNRFVATRGFMMFGYILKISGLMSEERFHHLRNLRLSFLMELEFGRRLHFNIENITQAEPQDDECGNNDADDDNDDDDNGISPRTLYVTRA